jgi:hypothetical protein
MRDGLLAAAKPSASLERHDGGRRAMPDGLLGATSLTVDGEERRR